MQYVNTFSSEIRLLQELLFFLKSSFNDCDYHSVVFKKLFFSIVWGFERITIAFILIFSLFVIFFITTLIYDFVDRKR